MGTGRNEPCPCGSGRKYKKCCLLTQEVSFDESSILLDAETRLSAKLFAFYQKHRNDIPIEEVGRSLFGDDFGETMLFRDETKGILFNQFCIFDYKRPGGSTLLEKFHVEEYLSLDENEKLLVNQLRDARWGLFEMQEVYHGKGSFIKDVFSDKTYNLRDIASSRQFKKWDIVFAKIKPMGSVWRFATTGVIQNQSNKEGLSEFIRDTFEEYKRKKKAATLDEFINTYPHLIIHSLFTAKPRIPKAITPEGDEMEMCKTGYSVSDFKKAAETLMEQDDFSDDETDTDSSGNPIRYSIGWRNTGASNGIVEILPGYRPQNVFTGNDGETVRSLGHIIIEPSRLTLECMSKRRMLAGRKRIESLLNDLISHSNDECKSLEQALMERQQNQEDTPPPKAGIDTIPEEIKNEIIMKQMEGYYSRWADMSIPMLNNFSPRDASMTEAGEDMLEELWKYMENMEMHSKERGNDINVPVSVLREKLSKAKAETDLLISGENINPGNAEIESAGKDFLADLGTFTDFVKHSKIKLSTKYKFIPDEQVRGIMSLLKVKDNFAIVINDVSIDIEKRESNKDRFYLVDMLFRTMGITEITDKNMLEVSLTESERFASQPECLRLWRLFSTWWYKIYWNQSLPREMGQPDKNIFDSLLKKVFIKDMLEKCGNHYSLKELVWHVFELLGKDPDSFEFIGSLIEKCMVRPLAWFGIIEVKMYNPYSTSKLKIDDPSMQQIDTLKVTPMGKLFLSHLILCQD